MEIPVDSCCDSPRVSLPKNPEERIAECCKALGHPIRLQILRTLIDSGSCISGDLSDRLPIAASTVSEHLKILKASGLVKGSVDGPRRNYCVNIEVLDSFKQLIQNL